jgi:VanZ family protein
MRRALKYFFPIITVCVLAFIWHNSAADAVESTEASDRVLEIIKSLIGEQTFITDYLVRKAAHFSEFALLGYCLCMDARLWTRDIIKVALFVPLMALMSACIDETVQLFSLNRASMLADVWLDFSGAIFGALFCAAVLWIVCRLIKNK